MMQRTIFHYTCFYHTLQRRARGCIEKRFTPWYNAYRKAKRAARPASAGIRAARKIRGGNGHMLDDLIELALELIFEGSMEDVYKRQHGNMPT